MYNKNISEDEIISRWSYKDRIYISCVCNTFNQEAYIETTINSFLNQNVDRRFEIIIHDDASTDNTIHILKRYEKQYPNIITLILQSENQYSKGKRILPIVLPYANGDYIALCEGDDFWCNNDKLQLQYNAMNESNTDICFTPAIKVKEDGTKLDIMCKHSENAKVYPLGNVIRNGGGFMPTASLFFRRRVVLDLPIWFSELPIGDYYLQIFASVRNGAYYLPEITSAYRVEAIGSWSLQRKINNSESNVINEYNSRIRALTRVHEVLNSNLLDFEFKMDNYRYEALSLSLRNKSVHNINNYSDGYIDAFNNLTLIKWIIVSLSKFKFIRPMLIKMFSYLSI